MWSIISINFGLWIVLLILLHGRNFARNTQAKIYKVSGLVLHWQWLIIFWTYITDWYTHKISYPWLLPGFNHLLSHILEKFWNSTPGHSNLLEMAHIATNRNTNIQLRLLEAIEKWVSLMFHYKPTSSLTWRCWKYSNCRAQVFDTRVAESIIAALKTCVPQNINNSEKARMSCNIGRQAHQAEKNSTHCKLDSDIADTRYLLNASAQTAKDLKAQLKELTNKKKEAG